MENSTANNLVYGAHEKAKVEPICTIETNIFATNRYLNKFSNERRVVHTTNAWVLSPDARSGQAGASRHYLGLGNHFFDSQAHDAYKKRQVEVSAR